MTIQIPLKLLFPMIYYMGGIEWYHPSHLLSVITYLYFMSLSFTTILMHTDFVAHHNSITTTPCPAPHHQMGHPRISTIDCAAWKASIPRIWMTRPLNWWPYIVYFVVSKKLTCFSFFLWTAQPPLPQCSLSIHYQPSPPLLLMSSHLGGCVSGTGNRSHSSNRCYV